MLQVSPRATLFCVLLEGGMTTRCASLGGVLGRAQLALGRVGESLVLIHPILFSSFSTQTQAVIRADQFKTLDINIP